MSGWGLMDTGKCKSTGNAPAGCRCLLSWLILFTQLDVVLWFTVWIEALCLWFRKILILKSTAMH